MNVGGTTVTGQAVELASKISAQFQQDQNNDGLLGLAFSSINTGEFLLRLRAVKNHSDNDNSPAQAAEDFLR